jgi:hypothetical protein
VLLTRTTAGSACCGFGRMCLLSVPLNCYHKPMHAVGTLYRRRAALICLCASYRMPDEVITCNILPINPSSAQFSILQRQAQSSVILSGHNLAKSFVQALSQPSLQSAFQAHPKGQCTRARWRKDNVRTCSLRRCAHRRRPPKKKLTQGPLELEARLQVTQ